jgi:hypothetical protein
VVVHCELHLGDAGKGKSASRDVIPILGPPLDQLGVVNMGRLLKDGWPEVCMVWWCTLSVAVGFM